VRIRIDTSDLDTLAEDLDAVAAESREVFDKAAKDAAGTGNRIGKGFARRSAGTHGRRYPSSWSVARTGVAAYVYGPTGGRAQGDMSFEYGSRNQKPHLDANRSADLIEQSLPRRVARDLGVLLERHGLG
jgi:hypothetical protein